MGIFNFFKNWGENQQSNKIDNNVTSLQSIKDQKERVIQKSSEKITYILLPQINKSVEKYAASAQYGLDLIFTLSNEISDEKVNNIIKDYSPSNLRLPYSLNTSLKEKIQDTVSENIMQAFTQKGFNAGLGAKEKGRHSLFISEPKEIKK